MQTYLLCMKYIAIHAKSYQTLVNTKSFPWLRLSAEILQVSSAVCADYDFNNWNTLYIRRFPGSFLGFYQVVTLT